MNNFDYFNSIDAGRNSDEGWCPVCGELRDLCMCDEYEGEDIEFPADEFGGHEGFYMNVDGEPIHMLADPNMSGETAEALAQMIRAIRKAVENGTLGKKP